MDTITLSDLQLINELSSRTYTHNSLLSNASQVEKVQLVRIKRKLKSLAEYFANKYNDDYGPFDTSVVTGNDIAIRGTNLKRIWSTFFKGVSNKQYAAQITFVINPFELCLDVGFYFGSASGHRINRDHRIELEEQLRNLGLSLSNTITKNDQFRKIYLELFDFGFTAYSGVQQVSNDAWYYNIGQDARNSRIFAKIHPNDFDVIENSTIDSFVSQVIFLMGGISNQNQPFIPIIKPLTPEQRAKKAERLAEIGYKGELHIIEKEKEKLKSLGIDNPEYPKHVALESTAYGYDIVSLNENELEIFIEVKTTTRTREDNSAKKFFISSNEYRVYENNKLKFKLYRVYDIENYPSYEELDLRNVNKEADGYICKY